MKICNICNINKPLDDFNKDKCKSDGYMNFCKVCRGEKHLLHREVNNTRSKRYRQENKKLISEKQRESYQNNKEHYVKKWKIYRQKNKKRSNEMSLIYQTNRRKVDKLYKLIGDIRSLILISFKKQGFSKRSKTFEILGCSSVEFKLHLENQFRDGMNWNNHGEWHIDHITPISHAKSEEDIYKLNHYSNFQPLWAKDNLSKGNRFIG